jgi:pimeloyl-ACP methyl ester carboxylesterase
MLRERMVGGDGVRLYVRELPGEGSDALLVHGLASSSHIWDLVGPRLSRHGIRTVAYDQRGHGRSDKPSSGYGFDRTTADAAAVIRAMRLRTPVVVGHSWGANVVLELAVRHSRLVSGAVLLDGGFVNLHDRFDWRTAKEVLAPPDFTGMTIDELLQRMNGIFDRSVPLETMVGSLMHVGVDGTFRPRLTRANHLRILRALWKQDTDGLLRHARVPVLVLAVRSSPDTPDSAGFMQEKRAAAGRVRAIGPPVAFEWIDGIHDVPLQRPEAVARRIVRFARGADTRVPHGRS